MHFFAVCFAYAALGFVIVGGLEWAINRWYDRNGKGDK